MCGISGYISKKSLVNSNAIEKTLNLMKRRGPDHRNYYKNIYQNKEVALLHSRLNIIDLKARSNQPFQDGNYILIFNGEIYNYIELKKDLIKKNYKFKTNSDTEVLIKSYIEYGEKCVDHFIGMWTFAIWDNKKKTLFLSRDPFGEKPLYYYLSSEGFFFGSEIKFIKSLCKKNFKFNFNQIQKNLFLGYKSLNKSNNTFFEKIFLLEGSSNLLINLDLKFNKKKYWSPELKINNKMKYEDAVEGVKSHLSKSLNLRMRADVPITFCLSGGIDSTLLASYAKKILKKEISTFSIIDSDERYNERSNIDLINKDLKCDFNIIELKNKKNLFFDRLKELTNYHDGPIATLSYYIHSFLSENISKKNIKVSISGTGADEIFTGYYDHFLQHLSSVHGTNRYDKDLKSWEKFILPLVRNPSLKNPLLYINDKKNIDNVYEKNFKILNFSKKNFSSEFEENNYCEELLRKRMLNELFSEIVPVILKHDDLNSMYYSVENRSPYLDRNLLEFSLTIPSNFLISNGYQKKILRDSSDRVLLDQVRLNREKKGFNASINSIVDLKNSSVQEFIFDEKSEISEYIDLKKLRNHLGTLNDIPNHFSKLIFSIMTTKFFLDNKINK